MSGEMSDYSGPFKPDLTLEDFSKDFLLKLANVWQYAWLHMTEAWCEAVRKRFGAQVADECELEAWLSIGERVNPRYAKVANIQLNTVEDCLKCPQLPLDNWAGGLFPAEFDIKGPNLAIVTQKKCRSLEFFEKKQPEKVKWLCQTSCPQVATKYAVHPKIKLTPLKVPPRKSRDEIACQWEYRIED